MHRRWFFIEKNDVKNLKDNVFDLSELRSGTTDTKFINRLANTAKGLPQPEDIKKEQARPSAPETQQTQPAKPPKVEKGGFDLSQLDHSTVDAEFLQELLAPATRTSKQ